MIEWDLVIKNVQISLKCLWKLCHPTRTAMRSLNKSKHTVEINEDQLNERTKDYSERATARESATVICVLVEIQS